jgi:hypothetical protein
LDYVGGIFNYAFLWRILGFWNFFDEKGREQRKIEESREKFGISQASQTNTKPHYALLNYKIHFSFFAYYTA